MTHRSRVSILLSFTACLLTFAASGDDINLFRVVLPNVFRGMPAGSTPLDDENGDLALAGASQERSLPSAYLHDLVADPTELCCPEPSGSRAFDALLRTTEPIYGGSAVFPLRC